MNICTRVGMCTYIRMYVHEYACLYNVCVCLRGHVFICQRFCVCFLYCTGECVYERLCTLVCACVCACVGAHVPVRVCVRSWVQACLCVGVCVRDFAKQPTHIHTQLHTRTHTQQYNLGVDVCSAFLAFVMRSPNSSTRPAKQVARNSLSSCLTLAARRGAKHCVQMLRANRPATPRERTHT